jgi:hypothetical protein
MTGAADLIGKRKLCVFISAKQFVHPLCRLCIRIEVWYKANHVSQFKNNNGDNNNNNNNNNSNSNCKYGNNNNNIVIIMGYKK